MRSILGVFLIMYASPGLRADVPLTDITLTDIKKAKQIVAPSAVALQFLDPVTLKNVSYAGEGVIIDTAIGRCILANAHLFTRGTGIDTTLRVVAWAYQSSDEQPPKGTSAQILKLQNGALALDSNNDLVLLKPDGPFPLPAGWTAPHFRRDPLEVGEPVIAILNPFGIGHAVTSGTVSFVDRNKGGRKFLQVDTPSPDDSGGPVFTVRKDAAGNLLVELVGIASRGVRTRDAATGVQTANLPGITLVTPLSVIGPVLIEQWQVMRGGGSQ